MKQYLLCALCFLMLASPSALAQNEQVKRTAFGQDDFHKTYQHVLPLARAGDVNAQTMIAMLSLAEDNPEADAYAAFYWLSLAAAQGHGEAQFALAALYATGTGVRQDVSQAYLWAFLAEANGAVHAAGLRVHSKSKLTSAELEASKASLWQCLKSNYQICS